MRVVSDLQKFTNIENLHIHSKLNAIADRAKIQHAAQIQRRDASAPGRHLLRALGYQLHDKPPLAHRQLRWEDIYYRSQAHPARRPAGIERL